MLKVQLAFLVHVGSILSRPMIYKAHDGTVRYKRNDAVRLVVYELQAADPDEHNYQSSSQHQHRHTVKP
jgi:hypothetical protein